MRPNVLALPFSLVLFATLANGQYPEPASIECWRNILKNGALQPCVDGVSKRHISGIATNPPLAETFAKILAEALGARDPRVTRAAARTLDYFDAIPEPAHNALIAAAKNPDAPTRAVVATALAKLRATAVEPLSWLASDPVASVRENAASSLGGLCRENPQAAAPLLKLAADAEATVRVETARALGACGGREAAARLLDLFADSDQSVRSFAGAELERLAAELGPQAAEVLAAGLQRRPADTLWHAGALLGRLKPLPEAALEALREAARSQDTKIRYAAAWGLRAAQPPEIDLLLTLAGDAHPGVRYAAASSLGECANGRAAVRLVELLADLEYDHMISRAARDSLTRLGPAATDALLAALKHPRGSERYQVVTLLGKIEDTRVSDAFVALLEAPLPRTTFGAKPSVRYGGPRRCLDQPSIA